MNINESNKEDQRFSQTSKQATGNGRIPRNPDVPGKGYDPKNEQDKLPPKKHK